MVPSLNPIAATKIIVQDPAYSDMPMLTFHSSLIPYRASRNSHRPPATRISHPATLSSLLLNRCPPLSKPIRPFADSVARPAVALGSPVEGGLEIEQMPCRGD